MKNLTQATTLKQRIYELLGDANITEGSMCYQNYEKAKRICEQIDDISYDEKIQIICDYLLL